MGNGIECKLFVIDEFETTSEVPLGEGNDSLSFSAEMAERLSKECPWQLYQLVQQGLDGSLTLSYRDGKVVDTLTDNNYSTW